MYCRNFFYVEKRDVLRRAVLMHHFRCDIVVDAADVMIDHHVDACPGDTPIADAAADERALALQLYNSWKDKNGTDINFYLMSLMLNKIFKNYEVYNQLKKTKKMRPSSAA